MMITEVVVIKILEMYITCRDGYIIGVTEPRRVAAVCMAERVAAEMNLTHKFVQFIIHWYNYLGMDKNIYIGI